MSHYNISSSVKSSAKSVVHKLGRPGQPIPSNFCRCKPVLARPSVRGDGETRQDIISIGPGQLGNDHSQLGKGKLWSVSPQWSGPELWCLKVALSQLVLSHISLPRDPDIKCALFERDDVLRLVDVELRSRLDK